MLVEGFSPRAPGVVWLYFFLSPWSLPRQSRACVHFVCLSPPHHICSRASIFSNDLVVSSLFFFLSIFMFSAFGQPGVTLVRDR